MLEEQQAQLVAGLQELYRRLLHGHGWIGSPVEGTDEGTPLTHEILERLGALKQDGRSTVEVSDEDLEITNHTVIPNETEFTQTTVSPESDSEENESPMSSWISPEPSLFVDPSSLDSFQPTSLNQNLYHRSAPTAPPKMRSFSENPFAQDAVDPAFLQFHGFGLLNDASDDGIDPDYIATFDPATFLLM